MIISTYVWTNESPFSTDDYGRRHYDEPEGAEMVALTSDGQAVVLNPDGSIYFLEGNAP